MGLGAVLRLPGMAFAVHKPAPNSTLCLDPAYEVSIIEKSVKTFTVEWGFGH
jgi:hypothetical protein